MLEKSIPVEMEDEDDDEEEEDEVEEEELAVRAGPEIATQCEQNFIKTLQKLKKCSQEGGFDIENVFLRKPSSGRLFSYRKSFPKDDCFHIEKVSPKEDCFHIEKFFVFIYKKNVRFKIDTTLLTVQCNPQQQRSTNKFLNKQLYLNLQQKPQQQHFSTINSAIKTALYLLNLFF
ncbi:hypothetical protein FF38_06413 [Lucilia cuprina]|uniref:Uncharacterized protein n=1 Tax=Lucilia cuprina TaxID=7375 RepID=A0A0L0C8S3_LUCCU|nr:hypothetical protein FF38_06413 [Lucilia cuprina]